MPITNLISLLCLCLCLSLCVSVSLSFFSCHHRLVSHSLYHTIYLRLFCLSIFLLFDISPLNLLSPFFYFSPSFDCTHTHSMRYYLSPFAYRSPPLLISLRSIFFCRVAKNSNSTGFCSSFSNFPPFHLSSELAINLNSANHRAVVEKVEIE